MIYQRKVVCIVGSSGKGGPRTYVGWTNDLDRRLARHNLELARARPAVGFGACTMRSGKIRPNQR
jgi:hypothetical protein